MPRYALILEYDGRPFCGWQRQDGLDSVQAVVEAAAARFSGQELLATAAGRTDAGVHATGQVVHLDLAKPTDLGKLRDGLNHLMRPWPVAVLEARAVDAAFHARFSALGRAYRYRIATRRARPTVEQGLVWHHPHALEPESMHAAGQCLLGRHDFTSFRASLCQAKSPVKTLDRLQVATVAGGIEVRVQARSFLHHQVRNIVGTLAEIGKGRRPIAWIEEVLAARDRAAAGPTAPPDGLTLVEVAYAAWSSRSTS